MSETKNPIGTLLTHGKEHGLWQDMRTCLESLGFDYEATRRDISHNNEIRTKIEALLQGHNIDIQTSDLDKPLPKDFKGLYFMGDRLGLWKSFQECGDAIGLFRATVGKYVTSPMAQTPRGRTEYKAALEKLRLKMQGVRKRMRSERDHGSQGNQSSPDHNPQGMNEHQETAGAEGDLTVRDRSLVAATVQELFALQASATKPVLPPTVRPSDWRDQLVAGGLEIADGQHDTSLRFLLQLIPDAPTLTTKEIANTKELTENILRHVTLLNLLLEEQRRRLQIVCQTTEGRREAVGKLLRGMKQLLGEVSATAVMLQAMQEGDLEGNLPEYLELFRRHFRTLFPPKLS